MVAKNVVEIEADGANNESLRFPPAGRVIRGRWDWGRCTAPMAAVPARSWPGPIPGQRVGVDLARGVGYVAEPLCEPEHAPVRDKIEKDLGAAIAPEREELPGADPATWLWWMRRSVDDGHARVVRGDLPSGDEIEKEHGKARREFFHRAPEDPRDDLIRKLVGLLATTLPADKRKEIQGLFDEA